MSFILSPFRTSHQAASLKVSQKQLQGTLVNAGKELRDLHIPKLKEALIKILELVDLCKKLKSNQQKVCQESVDLLYQLYETTLAPIMYAKWTSNTHVPLGLIQGLQTLFMEIIAAVPDKGQVPGPSRWLGGGDLGSAIHETNVRIEQALDTFLRMGLIEQLNSNQLVQPISNSGSRSFGHRRGSITTSISGLTTSSSGFTTSSSADISMFGSTDNLLPTVTEVLDKCPRIRILLLGRSGVGKSSLISNVFKVPNVKVSHYAAGHSDIYNEITSDQNPHFVLHDSLGYESGSVDNFNIIRNFIKERRKRPQVAEQLHAIWLCTSIPISGGRVFEAGDERIINMDLGGVPLIVVFTKYDTLVSKTDMEMYGNSQVAGHNDHLALRVKAAADEKFDELCLQPLRKICNRSTIPPYAKVSVNRNYQDTLSNLIKITRAQLGYDSSSLFEDDSIGQDDSPVGITWAIAQRADAMTSVNASIAVGRRKYWRGLACSLSFRGRALKRCLAALHVDCVLVWNFYDPKMHLISEEFKAMMSQVINDLMDHDDSNHARSLSASISGAAAFTGMLAVVAPPSAMIVGPIVAGAVFAKWVYDAYQQTPGILRCLMGYIVDLTIIMRRLYWRMQEAGGIKPLPGSLVKAIVQEYQGSRVREAIHREITQFVGDMGVFQLARRDLVLGKVIYLIRHRDIDPR